MGSRDFALHSPPRAAPVWESVGPRLSVCYENLLTRLDRRKPKRSRRLVKASRLEGECVGVASAFVPAGDWFLYAYQDLLTCGGRAPSRIPVVLNFLGLNNEAVELTALVAFRLDDTDVLMPRRLGIWHHGIADARHLKVFACSKRFLKLGVLVWKGDQWALGHFVKGTEFSTVRSYMRKACPLSKGCDVAALCAVGRSLIAERASSRIMDGIVSSQEEIHLLLLGKAVESWTADASKPSTIVKFGTLPLSFMGKSLTEGALKDDQWREVMDACVLCPGPHACTFLVGGDSLALMDVKASRSRLLFPLDNESGLYFRAHASLYFGHLKSRSGHAITCLARHPIWTFLVAGICNGSHTGFLLDSRTDEGPFLTFAVPSFESTSSIASTLQWATCRSSRSVLEKRTTLGVDYLLIGSSESEDIVIIGLSIARATDSPRLLDFVNPSHSKTQVYEELFRDRSELMTRNGIGATTEASSSDASEDSEETEDLANPEAGARSLRRARRRVQRTVQTAAPLDLRPEKIPFFPNLSPACMNVVKDGKTYVDRKALSGFVGSSRRPAGVDDFHARVLVSRAIRLACTTHKHPCSAETACTSLFHGWGGFALIPKETVPLMAEGPDCWMPQIPVESNDLILFARSASGTMFHLPLSLTSLLTDVPGFYPDVMHREHRLCRNSTETELAMRSLKPDDLSDKVNGDFLGYPPVLGLATSASLDNFVQTEASGVNNEHNRDELEKPPAPTTGPTGLSMIKALEQYQSELHVEDRFDDSQVVQEALGNVMKRIKRGTAVGYNTALRSLDAQPYPDAPAGQFWMLLDRCLPFSNCSCSLPQMEATESISGVSEAAIVRPGYVSIETSQALQLLRHRSHDSRSDGRVARFEVDDTNGPLQRFTSSTGGSGEIMTAVPAGTPCLLADVRDCVGLEQVASDGEDDVEDDSTVVTDATRATGTCSTADNDTIIEVSDPHSKPLLNARSWDINHRIGRLRGPSSLLRRLQKIRRRATIGGRIQTVASECRRKGNCSQRWSVVVSRNPQGEPPRPARILSWPKSAVRHAFKGCSGLPVNSMNIGRAVSGWTGFEVEPVSLRRLGASARKKAPSVVDASVTPRQRNF
ncbi:MAG: uncharacterized protein KVP18_004959 [Porospora cf. gigantea A]|uniref:uncharacterized protein n=1 Tax=Porospora cf. gigantea A TaxID=2853593 RepID=UPI00355A9FD9|nr:MAG: hypothetical protein KVP18_004959 [Porospora cf. gigantea A]